jgi:hypothetical protein
MILSAPPAQSIILSVGGAESMKLSACADSMILSADRAESMMLSVHAESIILSVPSLNPFKSHSIAVFIQNFM